MPNVSLTVGFASFSSGSVEAGFFASLAAASLPASFLPSALLGVLGGLVVRFLSSGLHFLLQAVHPERDRAGGMIETQVGICLGRIGKVLDQPLARQRGKQRLHGNGIEIVGLPILDQLPFTGVCCFAELEQIAAGGLDVESIETRHVHLHQIAIPQYRGIFDEGGQAVDLARSDLDDVGLAFEPGIALFALVVDLFADEQGAGYRLFLLLAQPRAALLLNFDAEQFGLVLGESLLGQLGLGSAGLIEIGIGVDAQPGHGREQIVHARDMSC